LLYFLENGQITELIYTFLLGKKLRRCKITLSKHIVENRPVEFHCKECGEIGIVILICTVLDLRQMLGSLPEILPELLFFGYELGVLNFELIQIFDMRLYTFQNLLSLLVLFLQHSQLIDRLGDLFLNKLFVDTKCLHNLLHHTLELPTFEVQANRL